MFISEKVIFQTQNLTSNNVSITIKVAGFREENQDNGFDFNVKEQRSQYVFASCGA